GNDGVPLVTALVQLTPRATAIQHLSQMRSMVLEGRDRRLRLPCAAAWQPAEDGTGAEPVLERRPKRAIRPALTGGAHVERAPRPLRRLRYRARVPQTAPDTCGSRARVLNRHLRAVGRGQHAAHPLGR